MNKLEEYLAAIGYLSVILAMLAFGCIPLWFVYKIYQGVYHILLLLIDKI